MTHDQFARSVRSLARRRPFRPFTIEFVNGKSLRITHPEGVASFQEVWLYRATQGSHVLFTASAVCRLHDEVEAAT